jgi:GAF domain-containing protein
MNILAAITSHAHIAESPFRAADYIPPLSALFPRCSMELLPTLLRIFRCEDPRSAFQVVVEDLSTVIPLRCAAYVTAADRRPRDIWPAQTELTADLLDTALHIIRAESFPLGSEFPFEATRFPDSEMLLLPLHRRTGPQATCILIAESRSFGESLEPWEDLAGAIEALEQRHERLVRAEDECEELRRRVEESEALHTLGLAANRTLDVDEVLNMVARFTRTLLGAHYVTVNTFAEGKLVTVASVGLRHAADADEDHTLARSVVEAERPLTIGDSEADLQVDRFAFHVKEGMKIGVGIPLSLFGDTFGALIVGHRRVNEITPRDTRLALTLAGHAAVAISNARLHERVEQRSLELQAAYDELNEATAAKERFFAAINHELRNPLSAVLGYQKLAVETAATALPEKALSYLQKSQQAGSTLLVLVNDLLDLSKIAAGRMELDLQPHPAARIVEEAVNTVRHLANERGIALIGPDAEDLPTIHTDAKRVQQVLVNLLSNAVKFTDAGEVRLEVRRLPSVEGTVGETPPGGEWSNFAFAIRGAEFPKRISNGSSRSSSRSRAHPAARVSACRSRVGWRGYSVETFGLKALWVQDRHSSSASGTCRSWRSQAEVEGASRATGSDTAHPMTRIEHVSDETPIQPQLARLQRRPAGHRMQGRARSAGEARARSERTAGLQLARVPRRRSDGDCPSGHRAGRRHAHAPERPRPYGPRGGHRSEPQLHITRTRIGPCRGDRDRGRQ